MNEIQKISVHYEIEVSGRAFNKALNEAREAGYDYGDASPIEIVRRSLIGVGVYGTFSEENVRLHEAALTRVEQEIAVDKARSVKKRLAEAYVKIRQLEQKLHKGQ